MLSGYNRVITCLDCFFDNLHFYHLINFTNVLTLFYSNFSKHDKCMSSFQVFKNKKLFDEIQDIMQLRHYSILTERTYCDWIKQYIMGHRMTNQ